MGIVLSINEAYFGTSSDFKKLESMIGEARKPYLGKKIGTEFMDDKNMDLIGEQIKKIFKFPVVDFRLLNDPSINAFCYPIGTSIFSSSLAHSLKITDDGKLNLKDTDYRVCAYIRVTTAMWGDERFTDREILAIILHEIGHSMQHLTNNKVAQFSNIMVMAEFISICINLCSGQAQGLLNAVFSDPHFREELNTYVKKTKILSTFFKTGSTITGLLKWFVNNFIAIVSFGTMGLTKPIIAALGIVGNFVLNPVGSLIQMGIGRGKKGAEYNADTFAASFGYGADLSSALSKMELSKNLMTNTKIEEISNSIPVIGHINNMMSIPCAVIMSPFSDHPITPKRIANILTQLEKELKKSDLSPALRKEIEKDIDDIHELMNIYKEPKAGVDTVKANKKWLVSKVNKFDGKITDPYAGMDKVDALMATAESVVEECISYGAIVESSYDDITLYENLLD